ncbi:MAG: hypothetical protein ABSH14_00940 [Verrucomicrobiia bacterium]|jgi:hypothetical protein
MQSGAPPNCRINTVIVCLLLVVACALFSYEARHNQYWPTWVVSALRNWQEVGYWNLHGMPTVNPGGIRPGESPLPYHAYRAFSLLPVYWTYLLTGNLNTALVLAYLALTLVLALSIWRFLGKNSWALLVASAVCLCPGYVRVSCVDWDPVPVAMLVGIAVMLFLVCRVANPPPGRVISLSALALVAVYSQIEWTTVFALGVGWATCAVLLWPTKRRQFMMFSVFVAFLVTASSLTLMWEKCGGGSGAFNALPAYTIGSGGYDGLGMSWSIALKRWLTASVIGLLPLWIVFFTAVLPSLKRSPRETLTACIPLFTAWMEVCVLRNHMAHHQWMQNPVVVLGILLSLYLLQRAAALGAIASTTLPIPSHRSSRILPWFTLGGTLYCMVILSVFRTNAAQLQSLIQLVSANTPRRAIIVVGPDLGRGMRAEAMGLLIDRKSVPMESTPTPDTGNSADSGTHAAGTYVINTAPLSGLGPVVAQSTAKKEDMVLKLVGWYRAHISQRVYHFQQLDTYYLYQPVP